MAKFWAIVDSETVVLYQAVVFTFMLVACSYLQFMAHDFPDLIEQTMGPDTKLGWVFLGILGPIAFYLSRGTRLNAYRRLVLQFSGDIACWIVLTSYVAATIASGAIGRGAFAGWIVASISICCGVLCLRDSRQLVRIERNIGWWRQLRAWMKR